MRKVRILVYLEDDSISVMEPPQENSGIPQGVLIKRQRLPKSENEYFKPTDFNLGIELTFYGKTFRIVSCDRFTEKYMTETLKVTLNAPESMPRDQYLESRNKPKKNALAHEEHHDKLRQFLLNDRKVLRFYTLWDDRENMYGELRHFVSVTVIPLRRSNLLRLFTITWWMTASRSVRCRPLTRDAIRSPFCFADNSCPRLMKV